MECTEKTQLHEPVYLKIYDLHKKSNDLLKKFGMGLFHTAVEVYGCEVAYAGHPGQFSGIFEVKHINFGRELPLRKSKLMGYTCRDFTTIRQYLAALGEQSYAGVQYDLIRHNCNHFTKEFIKYLCNTKIPNYVNRITKIGYVFRVPTEIAYMSEEDKRELKKVVFRP